MCPALPSDSTTHVVYRDGGLFTLAWLRWWLRLTSALPRRLPGRGFVFLVSLSFPDTARGRHKLKSTRLFLIVSTVGARLWRLTCVWETTPPARPQRPYGVPSDGSGRN